VSGTLDRRRVAADLLADRDESLLVVAGLGAPCWDVTAVGDHELTFPLWGAMGGATMIGLGLAVARPERRVLVVTGDGELLMGLSSLSTIGAAAPANLGIAVFDNEHYGETGLQPSNTGAGTDLAAVGQACGLASCLTVTDEGGVARGVATARNAPGPSLVVFKVSTGDHPLVVPPRDGPLLVDRFRVALGMPARDVPRT
jgi:thiamine pyrophosphate-dependent acetolactate synthase large subunit-like protein